MLNYLKSFYKRLAREGLIHTNPFLNITLPRTIKGPVNPTYALPPASVKRLLDSARKRAFIPNNWKAKRDYTLLAVLLGCGLRVGELLSISSKNVYIYPDKSESYIELIYTKNHTYRRKGLSPWVYDALKEYMEWCPEGMLFPISAVMVRKILSRMGKEAGLQVRLHPHMCRATAITQLLDMGFTHRQVAAFSGHANISMIDLYDKRRNEVRDVGFNLEYK